MTSSAYGVSFTIDQSSSRECALQMIELLTSTILFARGLVRDMDLPRRNPPVHREFALGPIIRDFG